MGRQATVDELDMLAYADGHLDCDPITRANVEAHLAQAPELESRLRAYVMQTEALRAAYGTRLAAPIPGRIVDVLHRPAARRHRAWALNLTVAVAILFAGMAGWMAGTRSHNTDNVENRFVRGAYANYVNSPKRHRFLADVAQDSPPSVPEHAASFKIRAPNLASLGFVLVKQSAVRARGNQLIRLTYRAADGRTLNLYLGPRWTKGRPGIRTATEGAVSIAHWLQGPLVSVLVSRLPAGELGPLAEHVRHAMRHLRQRDTIPNLDSGKLGAKPPAIMSGQGKGPIPAAVLQSAAPRSGSAIAD